MKNIITILGAIIIASFILVSCGQNSNKQKELELKERELALKEKELALKEKDSVNLKSSTLETVKKDSAQETKKLPSDTKILTLMSPTYSFGDLAHLTFRDFTTHTESEYEWDGDIPALNEIFEKCENIEGCPALKEQVYSATLKFKLMEVYALGPDSDGIMGLSRTGKKEKRWVIVALKKINKP